MSADTPATAERPAPTGPESPVLPKAPVDTFKLVFNLLLGATIAWAALTLDAAWSRLAEAPADLWNLGTLMFGNMELDLVSGRLASLWESVAIAWVGTMLAAVVAVPMAFLAAYNVSSPIVSWVTRQIFNVLRAVPEILLALAFVPMFGLSLMAGVLAIAVGSVGTLGKLCYEVLEGINPGPVEAADAVGGNRLERLRWGVIPQAAPELASFVLYRFEVNIRASAVLGLVDAGGIGQDIVFSLDNNLWGRAGVGLVVVILGTIAIDIVSGRIRRRIVAGPSGKGRSRRGATGADAVQTLVAS